MYYFLLSKIITTPIILIITTPSVSGIQSGLVTHHHDQSILPVNLSTRNTRNNTVPNPIPFDDVLFAIMLYILINNYRNSI